MPPKRKNRKQLDVGTDQLIVDTAEMIIAQKGVEGLRLKDIAEEVGIKMPSLYSHFDSRGQIIERIGERVVTSLSALFEDEPDTPPLDHLLKNLRRFAIGLMSNPAYVRILLLDFASPTGSPEFNAVAGKPGEFSTTGPLRETLTRLEDVLRRGEQSGQFRKIDATEFYNMVLGLIVVNVAFTHRSRNADKPGMYTTSLENLLSQVETLTRRFVLLPDRDIPN